MGLNQVVYGIVMLFLVIICIGVALQAFKSWLMKFKWALTLPFRIIKKIYTVIKKLVR